MIGLLQKPEPIDFFMSLRDFTYAGHTIPDVARALGLPPRTVYSWKEVGPNYENGRAFVLLYQDTFFRDPPSKPFERIQLKATA